MSYSIVSLKNNKTDVEESKFETVISGNLIDDYYPGYRSAIQYDNSNKLINNLDKNINVDFSDENFNKENLKNGKNEESNKDIMSVKNMYDEIKKMYNQIFAIKSEISSTPKFTSAISPKNVNTNANLRENNNTNAISRENINDTNAISRENINDTNAILPKNVITNTNLRENINICDETNIRKSQVDKWAIYGKLAACGSAFRVRQNIFQYRLSINEQNAEQIIEPGSKIDTGIYLFSKEIIIPENKQFELEAEKINIDIYGATAPSRKKTKLFYRVDSIENVKFLDNPSIVSSIAPYVLSKKS